MSRWGANEGPDGSGWYNCIKQGKIPGGMSGLLSNPVCKTEPARRYLSSVRARHLHSPGSMSGNDAIFHVSGTHNRSHSWLYLTEWEMSTEGGKWDWAHVTNVSILSVKGSKKEILLRSVKAGPPYLVQLSVFRNRQHSQPFNNRERWITSQMEAENKWP